MAAAPETRYAPVRIRERWAEQQANPHPRLAPLRQNQQVLMRQIVRAIVAARGKILVGTDAANYGYGVMGFAAIEEMRLLVEAGVPAEQVFRGATTEAALAMRAERDFGRLRPGMRADIVLLDENPLDDLGAYRRNQGVMAHGRWMSRAALDEAMGALAALYARNEAPSRLNRASAAALVQDVENWTERGFVFNARILHDAAAAMRAQGHAASADALSALAVDPQTGPCAAIIR